LFTFRGYFPNPFFFNTIKKIIPTKIFHQLQPVYHFLLAFTAAFIYRFPSEKLIVIGITGLIIWNKVLATQVIPGEFINLCLIAHSDEALLAALFLFIWHWYNVHFSTSVFPMGTVFLTGYLSEELMIEEHYEHYVRVMTREGLESEIKPPHGGGHNPTICGEPQDVTSDTPPTTAPANDPTQQGGVNS